MTVTLLPDAEALAIAYLLTRSEITTIASTRVYPEIPSSATFPLLKVVRLGGAPVRSRPVHLDAPRLQVEAYADTKATARDLAATAHACLALAHEASHSNAVVTAVTFGEMLWLPDDTLLVGGKAQPRYVFDATVYAHTV